MQKMRSAPLGLLLALGACAPLAVVSSSSSSGPMHQASGTTIDALCDRLFGPGEEDREEARSELAERRDGLLPEMLDMLGAESPARRRRAAALLTRLDDLGPRADEVRQALVDALCNTLYGVPVRSVIAEALGKHSKESAEVADILGQELRRTGDGDYAASLADALVAIGPQGLPLLVEAAEGRNDMAAFHAVFALRELGEAGAASLIDLIPTVNERYRSMVISGLEPLGRTAAGAAPVLRRMLEDEKHSGGSAGEAARALARIEGEPSVPVLLSLLGRAEDDHELRGKVIAALGMIGPGARAALPQMVAIIRSASVSTEELMALVEALPAVGSGDHRLQEELRAELQGSPGRRLVLMQILARLNAPFDTVAPYLAEALTGRDRGPFSRIPMLRTLATTYGEAITPAIRDALGQGPPTERGRFMLYVVDFAPDLAEELVDVLVAWLAGVDPDLGQTAVKGLALLGARAEKALPAARALAESTPQPEVRTRAAAAVEAIERALAADASGHAQ